jgi:hypothetical protein
LPEKKEGPKSSINLNKQRRKTMLTKNKLILSLCLQLLGSTQVYAMETGDSDDKKGVVAIKSKAMISSRNERAQLIATQQESSDLQFARNRELAILMMEKGFSGKITSTGDMRSYSETIDTNRGKTFRKDSAKSSSSNSHDNTQGGSETRTASGGGGGINLGFVSFGGGGGNSSYTANGPSRSIGSNHNSTDIKKETQDEWDKNNRVVTLTQQNGDFSIELYGPDNHKSAKQPTRPQTREVKYENNRSREFRSTQGTYKHKQKAEQAQISYQPRNRSYRQEKPREGAVFVTHSFSVKPHMPQEETARHNQQK